MFCRIFSPGPQALIHSIHVWASLCISMKEADLFGQCIPVGALYGHGSFSCHKKFKGMK